MTKRNVTKKSRGSKAKERTAGKPIPFRPVERSKGVTMVGALAELTNSGAGRKPAESVLGTENPEIRRAAKRAGITPAVPPELPDISELDAIGVGLTAEDKALLAEREADFGRPPKLAEHVMRSARVNGKDTRGVALALRNGAHELESIAERLTVAPETRDSMLADALEVIAAAEQIFYVEGEGDSSEPVGLMREALRAAEQEFDLFSAMKESRGSELHWQELWRAGYRAKLARLLADFRRTHGVYKPTKAEQSDDDVEAVAS